MFEKAMLSCLKHTLYENLSFMQTIRLSWSNLLTWKRTVSRKEVSKTTHHTAWRAVFVPEGHFSQNPPDCPDRYSRLLSMPFVSLGREQTRGDPERSLRTSLVAVMLLIKVLSILGQIMPLAVMWKSAPPLICWRRQLLISLFLTNFVCD